MKPAKVKRLRAAGWKVGGAQELLGLTDEEAAIVEIRLALANAVKESRRKRGLSQAELAQRMRSSQSRVAKLEAGDPSVSLDLLVRALLAAGATRRELRQALAA